MLLEAEGLTALQLLLLLLAAGLVPTVTVSGGGTVVASMLVILIEVLTIHFDIVIDSMFFYEILNAKDSLGMGRLERCEMTRRIEQVRIPNRIRIINHKFVPEDHDVLALAQPIKFFSRSS